jgi:hypothetical protein
MLRSAKPFAEIIARLAPPTLRGVEYECRWQSAVMAPSFLPLVVPVLHLNRRCLPISTVRGVHVLANDTLLIIGAAFREQRAAVRLDVLDNLHTARVLDGPMQQPTAF